MLTLRDCLDMCDLPAEVIDTIAQRERLPSIVAAELGNCLASSNSGLAVVHRLLLDDIADAVQHGDSDRLDRLERALKRFKRTYPGMPAM